MMEIMNKRFSADKCQLISRCPFGVFKSPKKPNRRGQIKKIRALNNSLVFWEI